MAIPRIDVQQQMLDTLRLVLSSTETQLLSIRPRSSSIGGRMVTATIELLVTGYRDTPRLDDELLVILDDSGVFDPNTTNFRSVQSKHLLIAAVLASEDEALVVSDDDLAAARAHILRLERIDEELKTLVMVERP